MIVRPRAPQNSHATGDRIRYLGSLLMRGDEVVLCCFAGSEEAVRRVAERAAIPFERILETAASPWPAEPEQVEAMRKPATHQGGRDDP